jgi:hypothetical protein
MKFNLIKLQYIPAWLCICDVIEQEAREDNKNAKNIFFIIQPLRAKKKASND